MLLIASISLLIFFSKRAAAVRAVGQLQALFRGITN
jgi:hypothetical protein